MTDEQDRLTNYLQTPDDPATDPLLGLDDESSASTPDIFSRRELLKVGTVPAFDRIVGRNEEMKDIATELRHLAKSVSYNPSHIVSFIRPGLSPCS